MKVSSLVQTIGGTTMKNSKKRISKFVYDPKTGMLRFNTEKNEKKYEKSDPRKPLCCASPLIVIAEVLRNSKN